MSYFRNVIISDPLSPFGDLSTVTPNPEVQLDFVYGLREGVDTEIFSANNGTVAAVDSTNNLGFVAECQTSTTAGGYGFFRSLRSAKYRAGQGIEARFTADFDTGVANYRSAVGFINIGTELSFGYNGANFSILHRRGGRPEIRTLTLTAGAGGAETATITLNSVPYTANITAGSTAKNAAEIAADSDFGTDKAWNAFQVGSTVVFVNNIVGTATGTYSYSATGTSAGSLAQTGAGQAVTDNFVAQASWNGSVPTGFDPTLINLYKITYQYLGGGLIRYYIYDKALQNWRLAHTIEYPNTSSDPNLDYPILKFGCFAADLTGAGTTDLGVRTASAALFNNGINKVQRDSRGTSNSQTGVSTTLTNVVTIRNGRIFNARQNLNEIIPIDISISHEHNKAGVYKLIKNATIAGTTNYSYLSQGNSYIEKETTSATVSGGTEIATYIIPGATTGAGFSKDIRGDNIKLLRGETLTLAYQTTTGNSTRCTASMTWLED